MRKYEAVFILDPRKVEGNGGAFDTTIQETLKANGATIERVKDLGSKVFAYPIKKQKTGLYWDYVVTMGPEAVAKVKDYYRLNPSVLRLVFFLFEDGQDDDVFSPSENRDKLFRDDTFGDGFDRDERPYGGGFREQREEKESN